MINTKIVGRVYTYTVGIIRKIPELVLIEWLKLFELLKKKNILKTVESIKYQI